MGGTSSHQRMRAAPTSLGLLPERGERRIGDPAPLPLFLPRSSFLRRQESRRPPASGRATPSRRAAQVTFERPRRSGVGRSFVARVVPACAGMTIGGAAMTERGRGNDGWGRGNDGWGDGGVNVPWWRLGASTPHLTSPLEGGRDALGIQRPKQSFRPFPSFLRRQEPRRPPASVYASTSRGLPK